MHLIWWLVGTFGIGAVALGVAVIVLGWPAVIGSKIGRMAIAVGGAAAAVAIALANARRQGAADQLAKQEKQNADFLKAQKARDATIAGATDAALDDSLREHTGKPGSTP